MPALLGPLVGFALGVALAWLGRAEAPREDEAVFRARVSIAALFAALVYGPACAYFLVFADDWSLFYLVDSRAVPSALLLVLAVVDAAMVVAGFVAAHHAARRRAVTALGMLGAGPAALAAGLGLAFFSRLRVDGTFHQVESHFGTRPVAGSPVGWAIVWMGAAIAGGLVVAARGLRDRRPRRRASREAAAPPPEGAPVGRAPLLGRGRR